MTDEEKKAIEFLDELKSLKYTMYSCFWSRGQFEFNEDEKQKIDIVLNLIQKQEKVIDEILKSWKQDDIRSLEELKQYFYRKVEDDEL